MRNRLTGIALAIVSLILFLGLLGQTSLISSGEALRLSREWIPQLGISFSFYLDGLGMLFALIITGIGSLIFLYAQEYLHGQGKGDRAFWVIFLFLLSMLGVVLSDNLILLFIFWELTSITSYILIGMNHEEDDSRASALQALLVTAGGGLALLVGLILIGEAAGTYELSQLLSRGDQVKASPWYPAILAFVLLGAFTKSAQFPFHFWLPNAMAAPTPVSAYLHSATMVKAGIYLLARLSPVLGGTSAWYLLLVLFGGITMVSAAVMAIPQRDLKRLLAYTTVSALGMMVLLIGVGSKMAIEAALSFIIVHALYKAALFLVVGAVDHETGTRDIEKLRGLARAMPLCFMGAIVAAISMCGIPPAFGFITKELIYEAEIHAKWQASWIIGAGFITNALTVTAGVMVGVLPFLRRQKDESPHAHEAPFSLWIGPLLLAALGIGFGLAPKPLEGAVIDAAFRAVTGSSSSVTLKLWHGLNPLLLLSAVTLLVGFIVVPARHFLFRCLSFLAYLPRVGPQKAYELIMKWFMQGATAQTAFIQTGSLHRYMIVILALMVVVLDAAFLSFRSLGWPQITRMTAVDAAVVSLIAIPAIAAMLTYSRLAAVLNLAAVGLGVTLLYVLYGAPDLALTQILVETLTFVLLMLMVNRLPKFRQSAQYVDKRIYRITDFVVSLIAGAAFCLLILQARSLQVDEPISSFFAQFASIKAHGRNVVNVILVDFRGLDTLGEITVVGLAALGVLALLQMKRSAAERT